MTSKAINLTLKVWRQNGPKDKGRFEDYKANNISTDMSFLEMLDVVNEELTLSGKDPIAFDSGLPGRHLRPVRLRGRRSSPWPREGHHPLPAPHAPL